MCFNSFVMNGKFSKKKAHADVAVLDVSIHTIFFFVAQQYLAIQWHAPTLMS